MYKTDYFCKSFQGRLSEEDLWNGQYSQIEKSLLEGMAVCDLWVDVCAKLTGMYWKASDEQVWQGLPLVPDYCKSVSKRLEHILSLRTLHRQLTRLLTAKEQEELKTAQAFKPFVGLKPVHYNPYTEPLWQAAVRQFENSLKPAEQRISGKLRDQLSRMSSSAYQLMQEFKRYKELIKRENMQRELISEREVLLSELNAYIQTASRDFNSTSIKGPRRLPEVPEIVSNIYWVKPMKAKILDIGMWLKNVRSVEFFFVKTNTSHSYQLSHFPSTTEKTASDLLSDLSGFEDLKRRIKELCQDMDEYHNEQFDSWSREMLQRIRSQELT